MHKHTEKQIMIFSSMDNNCMDFSSMDNSCMGIQSSPTSGATLLLSQHYEPLILITNDLMNYSICQ